MAAAGTFFKVSSLPLGQRISTESIFVDLPRPKGGANVLLEVVVAGADFGNFAEAAGAAVLWARAGCGDAELRPRLCISRVGGNRMRGFLQMHANGAKWDLPCYTRDTIYCWIHGAVQ